MLKKDKLILGLFVGLLAGVSVLFPIAILVQSVFGGGRWPQLWEEFLLGLMLLLSLASLNRKSLAVMLQNSWIKAVFLYTAITLVYLIAFEQDFVAELWGLVINLRFLALALVGFLLGLKFKPKDTPIRGLIVWPLVLVICFTIVARITGGGIYESFGYDQSSVIYNQTLDQNPGIIREMSSTRGPNALGVYLVLPLATLLFLLRKKWSSQKALLLALGLAALALSFSRAGALALGLSVLIYVLFREGRAVKVKLGLLGLGLGRWLSSLRRPNLVYLEPSFCTTIRTLVLVKTLLMLGLATSMIKFEGLPRDRLATVWPQTAQPQGKARAQA